MLIVFGIRHFKIKSYQPNEFGLIDPSWNNTKFEAVQKYFHMMYIPFFPVGKMIGTRGTDGELYHLTPELEAHIANYNLQHKTLWYTFLGPLLAIVIFSILGITGLISAHKREKYYEAMQAKYSANAIAMIDHPSLSDYYQFAIDTNGGEGEYVSHQVDAIYHVIDFNDKAIQFGTSEEDPFVSMYGREYEDWKSLFADTAYNAFWVSKTDLKKAVVPTHDNDDYFYDYDGAKVAVAGKPRYLRIDDARVIDGPDFEASISSSSSRRTSIHVYNTAEPASDITFTKLTGEGTWTLEMDENDQGNFFLNTTKLSDDFSGKIECVDMEGKKRSFIITAPADGLSGLDVKKVR